LYIYLNLNSTLVNFSNPVGMPMGLKYKDIENTAKIIVDNALDNFNVVTLYDFDTRGYTLRYLVEYVYNKKPLDEISYTNTDEIFALSKLDYNYGSGNPWELNTFKPYNVERIENIGDGYGVFKLTRQK
jgi:hypothetical protein